MTETEQLLTKAKIAEQAERYDDMVTMMPDYVKGMKDKKLNSEVRNLLSVAYKNKIGARRSSWRIVKGTEDKKPEESEDKKLFSEYRSKIEKELVSICSDVCGLLDDYLIPSVKGSDEEIAVTEEKVFYYKMKGDYCRYEAEISEDESRKDASKKSEEAYQKASEHSEKLPPTNPVRLGLSLNFSVFYYEILNNHSKACEIAKKAFDDAISELDDLKEESYKDSTLIMQLLRDNLTLWTAEDSKDPEDDSQG